MSFRSLKSGNEVLTYRGDPLPVSLLDFWRWSVSDILSNATRGRFAEFIVASAIGVDLKQVRDEWQAYDLVSPEGVKIEVKSSAFVQSWNQVRPSVITFSIRPSRYWDANSNKQAKVPQRHADAYVFCLLAHLDKSTIDPMKMDQWKFFVVPTLALDGYKRSQSSITLKSLEKLSSAIEYGEIRSAVSAMSSSPRGTATNTGHNGAHLRRS